MNTKIAHFKVLHKKKIFPTTVNVILLVFLNYIIHRQSGIDYIIYTIIDYNIHMYA